MGGLRQCRVLWARLFTCRFPYYTKLQYFAIKYGADKNKDIFLLLLKTKNSILFVDRDRLNACAAMGHRITGNLLSNAQKYSLYTIWYCSIILGDIVKYGFENGGHSYPVFHFLRGVQNSIAYSYGLPRISDDAIWNDLLYGNELDQNEYMLYQSIWCASYLSRDLNRSNIKLLKKLLKISLKQWNPSFVKRVNPFFRNELACSVYDDVLKVKYSWRIIWGIFDDDIVLKNESSFPLTNVEFSATIKRRSDDSVICEKNLTCSFIDAGNSCKWRNIMSIQNGNNETVSGNGALKCDEFSVSDIVPDEFKRTAADMALGWYKIGIEYLSGRCVEKNLSIAKKMFEKSANDGYNNAQHVLGKILLQEQNYTDALKWFNKAAMANHAPSLFYLGLMHEGGQGVEKNLDSALDFYRRAAALDFQDAKEKIIELNRSVTTSTDSW